jgi:hypothetical protein
MTNAATILKKQITKDTPNPKLTAGGAGNTVSDKGSVFSAMEYFSLSVVGMT